MQGATLMKGTTYCGNIKRGLSRDLFLYSFDFILQIVEQVAVEELAQADFKPVADLLYRHDAGILTFLIQHTVNRRGRNAGHIRQRVDRYVAFIA